jgi:hypothetical protein
MVGITCLIMVGGSLILADAPVRKDAVIAIAGAAAVVGGLILVFLAVVVQGYQAFSGEVEASVKAPFECAMEALLFTFALSLACAGLAVVWLATGGGAGALYEAVLWMFAAVLLSALGAAATTIFGLVL